MPTIRTTIRPVKAEPAFASNDRDEPPWPVGHVANRGETLQVEVDPSVTGGVPIDVHWLRDRFRQALALVAMGAGRAIGHVNVIVVNDDRMKQLNRAHAREDHTTDVLSFDLSEDGKAGSIQADIAICADEACRRAPELGHSVERELLLYGLHGMLHCAGFDDRTEADYARMHAEEDRILGAIGVGATFYAPRQGGRQP